MKRRKIHGYKEAAKKKSKKLTYRELMMKEYGRDPCKCPKCGFEMELVKIWHPVYGDIYDLFKDKGEVIASVKKETQKQQKKARREEREESNTLLLFAM